MIGTTAALIMAGISAAGSVASSAIQSHAAGKAAGTQAASGEKALELQKQIHDQGAHRLDPFVALGSNAAGTLGDVMGMPIGAQMSSATKPYVPVYNSRGQALVTEDPGNPDGTVTYKGIPPLRDPNKPPPTTWIGHIREQQGSTLGDTLAPVACREMNTSGYAPPQTAGPSAGMVLMEAPDGSQQQIPSHLVQTAQQFGARIVGGA